MMKRSVNICAGDSPLIISSLVQTNVVPQMATVVNATRSNNNVFFCVKSKPFVSCKVMKMYCQREII